MAKRSDFAQKLLDDLRLRKERMAASQSSNQSTTVSMDAYAYAKQMRKGSRDFNPHKRGSNKALKPFDADVGSGRSFPGQEASQQVVLYGKGHKPEQIDLSMALAFALENGGNLKKINSLGETSILGVLHRIVGKKMDISKLEKRNSISIYHPSTSSFPTFSHEHIKEISKGAIKLNQILRACSNGLNFGTCSVEIGGELLKGAMDLEESLRMLVSLQEGSEKKITAPRKSRITLLEDEEEDDDVIKESGKKQLDRPCFSFDKSSKTAHKIQEIAETDIKHWLVAPDNPKETTNIKKVSHKRSLSYSPGVKTPSDLSEKQTDITSLQSRPEKGRIPSVVAKLMGLEIPDKVETKYTAHEKPSSKKKRESIDATKAAERMKKDTEQKANETEKVIISQTVKPRLKQADRVSMDQNTADSLAGKKVPTHSVILDMVMHHGKRSRKDVENPIPVDHSRKTIIKVDQRHGNNHSLNQEIGSKKVTREEVWKINAAKHWEQRGVDRRDTKEGFRTNETQLVVPESHKKSENTVILQEQEYFSRKMLHTDKRSGNNFLTGNHLKPSNNVGFQHLYMASKPELHEEKHQAEEREQHSAQQKPPLRTRRASEPMSMKQRHQSTKNTSTKMKENADGIVNLEQPEKYSTGRHQRDLPTDRSPSNVNIYSNHLWKLKPDFEPPVEVKSHHLTVVHKENNTKVHVRKMPRHFDEVIAKRNETGGNSNEPLKQKIQNKDKSYSEIGSGKISKSKSAEVRIIKSSNLTMERQTVKAEQNQKELEEIRSLNIPVENGHSKIEISTPNDKSEDRVVMEVENDHSADPSLGGGEHLEKSKISNSLNGTDRSKDAHPLHLEDQRIFTEKRNECLTESERRIKQILIKNQLFLNTAEAFFKLNIPFSILQANVQDFQYEDSKLILDCGYELTRRKGRMQELRLHNCMKMSIFSKRLQSLDDLIKQIHKDFEMLKLYGRSSNSESDVEDYLPKMLDEDLQISDADINCMWDLGWNETMFASIEKDDVIRDVEKYMLNNLIDEALRDISLLMK